MADLNPLYDSSTDNSHIADDTQQRLNAPLSGKALSGEDQIFLNQIMNLVEEGQINLYSPSTLLNEAVYNALSDEAKGQADHNAMNMLTKIREIVNLKRAGMDAGYQIENLVHSLRLSKERMEEHDGNIFII